MDCNKLTINRVRKTGVFVCVGERKRYWRWLCGTETGQTEVVRKVATSCWVFPELGERRWRAPYPGLVGSSWECHRNEGRWRDGVTRLSVCEKWRYAEMKGEMGYEHVGKKRLLISRLRQKYWIRDTDLRMCFFIYIFFFAYLIPCQRLHHPATDEQNSW